jgi:hypothetical protein
LAAVLSLAVSPTASTAHEIPSRVAVIVFVKPDATRLRLLVRVPLESMRDFDFPLRGMGYLDLVRARPLLRDAARLWIVDYLELRENDQQISGAQVVAARVSLPSDRSFGHWDSALAHVTGPPLSDATDIPWQQAMLDVLIEYPISSDRSDFSIRPALAHLGVRTTTVLRFLPAGGAERAFQYEGNPGLVRLDPRWRHAAGRFVQLGFQHILDGIDHLLFVLCLVIPFRRWRQLVAIVTSFTVAHSITLAASVMGLAPNALWFPPLIETLIALSIVFMAFENIVGPKLERRWLIAFGFGLVHGFGFSFALRDSLQFAGAHLATSLLSFNVGVEIGQLLVVALAIPLLNALFRFGVAERIGTILLSALVAHTAWHWMTDRLAELRQYQFDWPGINAVSVLATMRLLLALLALVAIMWLLGSLYGRLGVLGRRTAGADR